LGEFLPDLPSGRIYITEYFDPTSGDDGRVCDGTILADHPGVGPNSALQVTRSEATWVTSSLLPRLKSAIQAAATQYGWQFVDGIAAQFMGHGYCARDHWIVRYQESLEALSDVISVPAGDDVLPSSLSRLAEDSNGTLHPNRAGHLVYQKQIAAKLEADFYEDGDLAKPRLRKVH
jgi:hypothetical protein